MICREILFRCLQIKDNWCKSCRQHASLEHCLTQDFNKKTVHASCVLVQTVGVLIIGASGTGKSALALRLIGLGGKLVADDRTILTYHKNQIIATCPATIKGKIEARGVGIINLSPEKEKF